jgi:hypothetical protein
MYLISKIDLREVLRLTILQVNGSSQHGPDMVLEEHRGIRERNNRTRTK